MYREACVAQRHAAMRVYYGRAIVIGKITDGYREAHVYIHAYTHTHARARSRA